jgi:4-hydroxythreonine-4-phosphate dehydrogenase
VRLALTPGMGVGPEVTARAIASLPQSADLVLMGDGAAISAALDQAGLVHEIVRGMPVGGGLQVIDTRGGTEAAPVAAIRLAARAALAGEVDAMVTGPINKAALISGGFDCMGHTDLLGGICGVEPVMAFTGGRVRVALVTTHIPLDAVAAMITPRRVAYTVRTANRALMDDLGLSTPRLALCGLNPHAGEQGKLGRCELDVLGPAADVLRAEGIQLVGPISAETAFMAAAGGDFDMVVAMYHDQGLVPLKVLDFGRSVNWTLGLPIIRTSVDHGTADALVGTGRADPSSMMAAIDLAIQIAGR